MRFLRTILVWVFLFSAPVAGWCVIAEALAPAEQAADAAVNKTVAGAHAEHKEGLPTAAPHISIGPLEVNNSMIMTWVVALFVIIFARFATRNIKAVPEGA